MSDMPPGSSPRSRLLVIGPFLLVLSAALSPGACALADADRTAWGMLGLAIVVAICATLPSWIATDRPQGWCLAAALKSAVVFALAPDGLATIFRAPAPTGRDMARHLEYFWWVPPALVLVTLAECTVLRAYVRGGSLRDTWLWQHRRPLARAAVFVIGSLAAWSVWKVDVHLQRLRVGHARAAWDLERVGAPALPRIERELEELGDADVGSYRDELAGVAVQIRRQVVQAEHPRGESQRVAIATADPGLVRALARAWIDEPDGERRDRIANEIERLDFATASAIFCAVAPDAQARDIPALLPIVAAKVAVRDGPSATALGCVPTELVTMLERLVELKLWGDASTIADMLARFPTLDAATIVRLRTLADDPALTIGLISRFGARLTQDDGDALTDLLLAHYRRTHDTDLRRAILFDVEDGRSLPGVAAGRFLCDVLSSIEDERELWSITHAVTSRAIDEASRRCVADTLIRDFDAASRSPEVDRVVSLGVVLMELAASDEYVRAWARARSARRLDTQEVSRLLERIAAPATR